MHKMIYGIHSCRVASIPHLSKCKKNAYTILKKPSCTYEHVLNAMAFATDHRNVSEKNQKVFTSFREKTKVNFKNSTHTFSE